jgi:FKBP-type peptidyl-prolyl cis-trans isomerase
LEDGTQFDTNVGDEKPLKFRLGTAEKVKGLDIGV